MHACMLIDLDCAALHALLMYRSMVDGSTSEEVMCWPAGCWWCGAAVIRTPGTWMTPVLVHHAAVRTVVAAP
jgi:hypothetical protein